MDSAVARTWNRVFGTLTIPVWSKSRTSRVGILSSKALREPRSIQLPDRDSTCMVLMSWTRKAIQTMVKRISAQILVKELAARIRSALPLSKTP